MNLAKEGNAGDSLTPAAAEQFEYIADLLKELRVMALSLEADVLAHVIEVAMLEALLQSELEARSVVSDP